MDMQKWVNEFRTSRVKKALPILSFPAIQLMNISVKELIARSEMQAEGMRLIAERTDALASVSMMDLSVEAEAFGAEIRVFDDEVPTVIGRVITSAENAGEIVVPSLGSGRTGLYIDAIRLACKKITDRPVFAGVIGPFSLAGRLMDVSEAMVNCYVDPEMVHVTLEKATQFIIEYIKGYKEAGANGIFMAEPLAGMLSPDLNEIFSTPYVKRIIEATQQDDFIIIYHNCGDNVLQLIDSIVQNGAKVYHFGNAIGVEEIMPLMPSDMIAMGNIDPSGEFKNGTPESIRKETLGLMTKCSKYDNFVISSGCDIPPLSRWENIDAFFKAVKDIA